MMQYVDIPTRMRASDTPHILDLVISNSDFINNIEHLSPLGKSDHSVLVIQIGVARSKSKNSSKPNFNKADYNKMCQDLNLDWEQLLNPFSDSIDKMWFELLLRIQQCIDKYVPIHSHRYL